MGNTAGSHFGDRGTLSRTLPSYEFRQSQVDMADAIERTLVQGNIGLFEAGTGTGKSLAYIIPAAKHAIDTGTPVVISTYTIALQQQLIEKDIPVAQHIFPELRATLVKGWGNYVCPLRLHAVVNTEGESLFPEDNDELLRIFQWAKHTKDGTLEDLPFQPTPSVWAEVNAESDSCLRAQCSFYNDCHFFADRAHMARAHLLIVNHHLLFADIAIRRQTGWESDQAVLPQYGAVIIDESHHVEDVATSHMGGAVSSLGVKQLMGRLHARGGRGGLISRWRRSLAATRPDGGIENDVAMLQALKHLERKIDALFQKVSRWAVSDQRPFVADGGATSTRRISNAAKEEWEAIIGPLIDEARDSITTLTNEIARARQSLPDENEDDSSAALSSQMDAVRRRFVGLGVLLEDFRTPDPSETVYWVEQRSGRRRRTRLVSAPIDIGNSFVDWVEQGSRSVILVSATLSLSGSFQHVKRRLGLEHAKELADGMIVQEAIFPSPFHYETQALLAVTADLPSPTHSDYADKLTSAVRSLVKASDGRALILFTSYRLLHRMRDALRPEMQKKNMMLLAQGDAPRYRLLDAFSQNERSILLGTSSFWEGVDVPGEALSLVVLTRLPFDVPTEPVTEARAEQLRQMGLSPFSDYALPRAGLKLKQGFGRLVRNKSDRGAVVICDRRLVDKQYGTTLLSALPPARRFVGSTEDVSSQVHRFLRGEQ